MKSSWTRLHLEILPSLILIHFFCSNSWARIRHTNYQCFIFETFWGILIYPFVPVAVPVVFQDPTLWPSLWWIDFIHQGKTLLPWNYSNSTLAYFFMRHLPVPHSIMVFMSLKSFVSNSCRESKSIGMNKR